MLYGKRFGLLQKDVEEESLNFIKAVKTVWRSLYRVCFDLLLLLMRGYLKKETQSSVLPRTASLGRRELV